MAKRTLFTIFCLVLVLLVWDPAPKLRSARQQFSASQAALFELPAAGCIRLARLKQEFLQSDLIRMPRGGAYQVLRI